MKPIAVTFVALFTGVLVAGCAQPQLKFLTPVEPPIVWPKPPDAAHVRYVGSFNNSGDSGQQRSVGEVFEDLIYGPVAPEKFVSPQGVAVDDSGSRVAVADVGGKCVHVFDITAHKYTRLAEVGKIRARGETSPGIAMECPVAVCWAGETLWVADAKLHALAVFAPKSEGRWVGAVKLTRPSGMTYCPANGLCYVADAGAHRILGFNNSGEVVVEFGSHGTGPGQFNVPSHLACTGDTLVVADSLNFRVQRLGLDGKPINMFGQKGDAAGDMALPKGVAVDANGAIWVVDAQFENIQAFTADGQLLMAFGQEGHGPGEFSLPTGICIDKQNRMWVADTYNGRVQVFNLLQPTSTATAK